ncbi:MAG TPA: iron-sulfur cluster assembly accessory protein [Dehalococcoidia bacterium]|nr:iron-sulfur cluster assembly accessory protein [Dehalococcoidia bacterium]
MLNISPLAIEKLREVMEQEQEPNGSLRIVAMPAERGGLQYMLTMEKETQPDDTVLNFEGLKFLMDSDSAPFLDEATIDYIEQFGGRVGFVINNPMFASGGGCGCGSGGGGCGCGGGGGDAHGHEHGHAEAGAGACGCGNTGGCGCGGGHGH